MSAMKSFATNRPTHLAAWILTHVAATSALATGLAWNNAGGGAASTAGNWAPTQVPTASDDLTYNLTGAYAVTFNGATASSRTQTFRAGTVTLTMSAAHATSNGVTIGDLAGDAATVTLTTGDWSSGPAGFVNIGDAANSTGTLNVNDDDATFLVSGTSDLFVGNNGSGTLNVTGGGTVHLSDALHVGQGSAATGHLTVSGFVPALPFPISTLQSDGTGESRLGNGGDATVSIANGALAEFAGDVVIANLSTSNSSVSVQGPGLIFGATLDVAGDLLIGRNTSAGTAAGTGTLSANADGRVLVDGTLLLGGDPDGGAGVLNISSNGLVDAGSVAVGSGGTLNHAGGTLKINGGAFTGHATPLVVSGNGGPTLQLSNNLSKTINPIGGVALIVGDDLGAGSFSGNLRIDSGADLLLGATNADINIGDDSGTTGVITVDGAGSRLVDDLPGSDLRVGFNGNGTLNISNGGQVLARNVLVPAINSADGAVVLDGPNATLTTANLAVGHASGSGSGSVVDDVTTTITATDLGVSVLVRNTGLLAISGHLDAVGTILLAGGEMEVHGTVTAGTFVDVDTGGRIQSGAGATTAVVAAPVHVRSGGAIDVAANDLTVGDATDANGFIADDGSIVSVGAHTFTVHDQNRARFDTVTINGGQIVAPNGLEIVTPGTNGTLDGTGAITTSELFVESGGSVITATTAAGITINGKFRNNSGVIDGTKYTFNSNPAITDSGWTGAGTIAAQVVFNSGTKVNALANMTMGDGSNFGVTFNAGSELHADTRTVTLLDGNGVGLPSVTDVNGGHVVCAQPLTVNSGRRLSGRGGSVDSPTVTIFGRLSPGELVGVPVGQTGELTINGNLVLGDVNANTDIELQGLLGPVEYDRVVVDGTAVLDGDLNITFLNGFNPPLGSVWTIMDYESKTGDFQNINISGPSCVFVAVSDTAVVVFRGLPGDLDHDGDVDISDLALLLSNFGCHGGVEFPCPVDLDFNGDTDITDLAILLSNYGQTCN